VSVWGIEPKIARDPCGGSVACRTTRPGVVMAISPCFEVHREPVGKRVVAAAVLVDDA
jgi:hypothetical protein